MRRLLLLIFLLAILPASMTAASAAQTVPAARTGQSQPLTVAQRQFARQLGQRLARDPRYQTIDADWRKFVRSQPRGTDFRPLAALVHQEAINAKQREIHLLRKRLNESSQRKAALGRELGHARQLQPTPLQKTNIANLEMRYQTADDQNRLSQVDLQNALQRQQQLVQSMSAVRKAMQDAAMSVNRKIGG